MSDDRQMDTAMQLFAKLAASEVCPGCGAQITWKGSDSGLSVDILHPQPPCPAFQRFVGDLLERHRAARRLKGGN